MPSHPTVPPLPLEGGLTVRAFKAWRVKFVTACGPLSFERESMILRADPGELMKNASAVLKAMRAGRNLLLPPMQGTLKQALREFRQSNWLTGKQDPWWKPPILQ